MARADDLDPAAGDDAVGDDASDGGDDAAFHWAGDEARGQAGPVLAGSGPGAGDPTTATDSAGAATASGTSPARLIGTGLFGGIFLVFTVGWIFSVQAIPNTAPDLFGEIMWQFGEFLAIIAGALWFSATTYLTRETRSLVRFGWLALGALLLVPWPILWPFIWGVA